MCCQCYLPFLSPVEGPFKLNLTWSYYQNGIHPTTGSVLTSPPVGLRLVWLRWGPREMRPGSSARGYPVDHEVKFKILALTSLQRQLAGGESSSPSTGRVRNSLLPGLSIA